MVGEHHGIGAVLDREARVVRMHQPLDHQRARPKVPHPLDVGPVEGIAAHGAAGGLRVGGDAAAVRLGMVLNARHAGCGEVAEQRADQPARMQGHVGEVAHRRHERQAEAVARVVFAVRADRRVHRYDQRLVAGGLDAADQLVGEITVGPHVDLEPQCAAGLAGDFLQRRLRSGRQRERHAGRFRRPRQRQFALVPGEPGRAGRRHRERHADRLAEQRGLGRAGVDIDQHARPQLDALDHRAVVAQADLVLGAAIDVFENAARQPPLRLRAQVGNIVAVLEVGHAARPQNTGRL